MDDLFNILLIVGVIAVVYFSIFRDSNKNSNSKTRDPIRDLYGNAFSRFRNQYIDTRPESDLLKNVLNSSLTEAIHTCFDGIEYDYRTPVDDYDSQVKVLFVLGAGKLLIKANDKYRKGVIITDEERYQYEQLIYFCNDLVRDSITSNNNDDNATSVAINCFMFPLVQLGKDIGCKLNPERLVI